MLLIWLMFLFSTAQVCKAAKDTKMEWDFNQNDYDVKMERMGVTKYNHSIFRNFHAAFVPFNRTQRVLNASFEVLVDLTSNDMKLDVQAYIFRSNEYRFFPITVSVNWCVEYNHNSFHAKDILIRTSNIHGCPLRKGVYSIGNAMPEFEKFPPLIPRGQYKLNTNFYYKTDFLAEMDFYGSVNDKPMKWQK